VGLTRCIQQELVTIHHTHSAIQRELISTHGIRRDQARRRQGLFACRENSQRVWRAGLSLGDGRGHQSKAGVGGGNRGAMRYATQRCRWAESMTCDA
ncbi:MAG: hypothetical protein ACK559_29835, partial [bacterium]